MEKSPRTFVVHVAPQTWFGRVIAMVGAVAFGVLAMLFFATFAICVIVLAIIFLARAAWMSRISGQVPRNDIIDVEYSVDTTKKPPLNVSHMQLADDRNPVPKHGPC